MSADTMPNDESTEPQENIMTPEDMKAIRDRLEQTLYSCMAIHKLASKAVDCNDGAEWFMTAIEEMARANVKGLDACLEKIDGAPACGNFEGEFTTA